MRLWMKLLGAILVIALLLWLGWNMVSGIVGLIGGADLSASEPDPMFALEAEIPTRPPELDAEEPAPQRPTLDDYVPEVETPVDKTTDQLIREAQNNSNT